MLRVKAHGLQSVGFSLIPLLVNDALRDIIDTFQSLDPQTRMELLLDYSKKLPPLPEKLHAARDAGLGRVHECQTAVFLYIERDDTAGSTNGVIRIHADVAPEAPTVRGFVSLLVRALEGASPQDVKNIPNDLVHRLGLSDLLRMNREVGLSAVLSRIKREAMAA